MSLDGTFITDRKKTFFQGVALLIGGLFGSVITGLLTGRLEAVGACGLVAAWGAYLMLRAAKAGRNVGEVEGKPCVVCTLMVPSVMVGKFCEKCAQPIHNDCAGAHIQRSH